MHFALSALDPAAGYIAVSAKRSCDYTGAAAMLEDWL
jgi:hypothetical protein